MSEWLEVEPVDEKDAPRRWLNLDQVVTIEGNDNATFLRDVNGQGYLLKGHEVVVRNGQPVVRPKLSQPVRFA